QRHGGIAQGAAQALLEEVLYDADGNPVTSTFADYGMITAAELPSFELVPMETPTPLNELGVKGIGESGTSGAGPAVQNAAVDALAHLGMRHIDERDGTLAIGALARHQDLATSDLLRARCPLLAHAASLVGDPQVRHRGTAGGSVAHADPASDLCAVLRCLDARMVVHGPAGRRTVAAADFFVGFLEAA